MRRNNFALSTLKYISISAVALSSAVFADTQAGVEAWSRGDYAGAVKLWSVEAQKGNADAQYNLAHAYNYGQGAPLDLAQALDWYRRASAQGHLKATANAGYLLHNQGNVQAALPYLQTAADHGDIGGQYLLGTELFNGVYIEKDWVRAYALMTRAASTGMSKPVTALKQMDQYIPLEQRQQAMVLAAELEKRADSNRTTDLAGFPINTLPPTSTGRPISVPPSDYTPVTPPIRTPAPVKVATPIIKAPAPRPTTPPVKVATAKASVDGGWRIQLGAFGDEGNAQKLWNSLEARIADLHGLQPYLKSAGAITRLQAGPFASRSAAEAMCAKVKSAGQACIAIPK